jgi:phosphatidylglycerophosphatase A
MPIIVREVLVTFCRVGWLLEGKAAGAEKLGKVKFVFQVVLIYLSFAYLLALDTNRWQDLPDFCYMTLHIVLAVTVALTLISGVSFFSSNRGHFLSRTFAKYTSALGVGSIPFAPGTWGSLVGIGLACLGQLHWLFYASLFLAVFAAGYWAVSRLGLPKEADPRYVVVDEALGMMLALGGFRLNLPIVLAGFFLFRLFDVLKPFPLRQLEKIHGFWGILLDDLGAGIYTWLVLFLFFYML